MQLFSRYLNPRKILAGTAVIVALCTVTGCGEAIHNSAEDNSFIRQPGASSGTTNRLKLKAGDLLPVKAGSSWRNRVTVRAAADPGKANQDQPALYETVVAVSPPMHGGRGVSLEAKLENQNKPYRTETFQTGKRGIFLSHIGGKPSFAAVPPVPVVLYPLHEGEIKKWTGTVRLDGKAYPAQGYSRVGSLEEITLPQGKVTSCRIDTALIANVDGRQVSFPMARWFVPGVGMVRQRFISGNIEITKELVRYKI